MIALRALLGLVPWQAWVAGAGMLAFFGALAVVDHRAYERGKAKMIEAARVEAGKRIVEMEKNNADFRALPARDRCRAFMRDSGLPEHHCG